MHSSHPNFQMPSPASAARIEAILQKLSLEQMATLVAGHPKEGQTLDDIASGVPPFRMADGPVGVHWWCKQSTAYPALITLAGSWDIELARRMGEALGRDCRARGIHILLAPGVNLYRSPLAGRNFEYLGEDPELTARMAAAYVRGVQSQGVAATVKHFAANEQEFDRHVVSSEIDERTLREVYLRPFEEAVRAGAACIMTAYNPINGRHAAENDWLIRTVLKGDWQFDGLVMSDWVSTYSTVGSANAGLDLEMPTAVHFTPEKILAAIRTGLITPECLTDKVRRRLQIAAAFGWLDHPQQDETIPQNDPTSATVALDVARAGAVLLKNARAALPLTPGKVKRIVVLGYHATAPKSICGGGSAYTTPFEVTTLCDGLRTLAGTTVEIAHFPAVRYPSIHDLAGESRFETEDGQPGLRGEYFPNLDFAGPPALTRVDEHLQFFWPANTPEWGVLPQGTYSVRWTGAIRSARSGRHRFTCAKTDMVFRATLDGQPLFDNWTNCNLAPQTVTLELKAGRHYALRIETKPIRGFNIFWFGWQHTDEERVNYDAAMAAARGADAVIVTTGFMQEWESEGFDRTFALEDTQEQLIRDAAAANPRTAVVLWAGGAVDVARWIDRVPALIFAGYPGQNGGQALAEILLGKINPAGRLPFSWEQTAVDRSSYPHYATGGKKSHYAEGVFVGYRGHDQSGVPPQFAFGHGLSYTTFRWENFRASKPKIAHGESLTVTLDVTNTGPREGAEVVQIYVADRQASVPRPLKELKGFASVHLATGETQAVTVQLPARAFQFWDSNRRDWITEPGEFEICAGRSATEIVARTTVVFHASH